MRPPCAPRCPRSPSAYGVAPRARGSTRALEKVPLSLLCLLPFGVYSAVLGYEHSTARVPESFVETRNGGTSCASS